MKKILLLALTVLLVLSLSACSFDSVMGSVEDFFANLFGGGETPCTEHVDEDEDLICDVCKEPIEEEPPEDLPPLTLIENGVAKFNIVVSPSCGTKIKKAVDGFASDMAKFGVNIKVVNTNLEADIVDCEVIVGDVSSRGPKYDYEEHNLGIKGSIITRIDNKIIITAGTNDKIVSTFESFTKNVIGLTKSTKKADVQNVIYEKTDEDVKIQDDYRVTAIKIGDKEITGYTIAVDLDNQAFYASALNIQTTFYERAGYWLDIVPLEEATNTSIILKEVEKGANSPAGSDGFLAKTVNGQMQIYCSYQNSITKTISSMMTKILITQGEYVYPDNAVVLKENVSVIYYKDWTDIKGDGVTNDFEAIKALHEFANLGGQKVVAEDYKEYYIERTSGTSIVIQTDVDFGKATFTIDDQFITDDGTTSSERGASLFKITSKLSSATYTTYSDKLGILARIKEMGGLDRLTEEIPLNLGYDVMIIPYDTSKRIYMRWGRGEDGQGATGPGVAMSEIIVVRKDNKVDMSTTNFFDFDNVDKIEIYPIDQETLTISGGTFHTIATRANMPGNYVDRNILITRSNVVIQGMEHKVSNQPIQKYDGVATAGGGQFAGEGPNYSGWIYPYKCTDIVVKNSKFSGRAHYNQGSYDLGGNYANNLYYYNCTQYNMYDANGVLENDNTAYWGIHGTNYCKNITFDSCELSRFDAHAGVYNFTIKNSKMGIINAVGGGHAEIIDTEVLNTRLVGLREDYAASWRGDFYIKNVTMVNNSNSFVVFSGTVHDVDFGMKSFVPDLYIENFNARKYDGTYYEQPNLNIFNINVDQSMFQTGTGKINTLTPSTSLVIKQPANREIKILMNTVPYPVYTKVEYIPYEED